MSKRMWILAALVMVLVAMGSGAGYASMPSLLGPTGVVTTPNALVAPMGQIQTVVDYQRMEGLSLDFYDGTVDRNETNAVGASKRSLGLRMERNFGQPIRKTTAISIRRPGAWGPSTSSRADASRPATPSLQSARATARLRADSRPFSSRMISIPSIWKRTRSTGISRAGTPMRWPRWTSRLWASPLAAAAVGCSARSALCTRKSTFDGTDSFAEFEDGAHDNGVDDLRCLTATSRARSSASSTWVRTAPPWVWSTAGRTTARSTRWPELGSEGGFLRRAAPRVHGRLHGGHRRHQCGSDRVRSGGRELVRAGWLQLRRVQVVTTTL